MTLAMVAAALRSFADGSPDGTVRVPADYLRRLAEHIDHSSSRRQEPIRVLVVRWSREHDITCTLGQLEALALALEGK